MKRLIVVGAGPAGMTLALQLARAGRPVTLIDARRDFARSLRGDALMPCGQEALARMGLWPLLERLPQRGLQGWSIWIEGRELFRVAEPMGALQPCRLVRQHVLLEALLQEAQTWPTFTWMPGVAVSGLLQRDQQMDDHGESGGDGHHDSPLRIPCQRSRVCGVRLSDGRELEADLVIGCDGRDSTVRREAGLTLQPVGSPLHLAWLVMPREAMAAEAPTAGSHPAPGMAEGVSGDGYPWISAKGDTEARETDTPGVTGGDFLTLVAGGAIASACIGAGGELQLGWLLRPEEPLPERSSAAWAEAIAALAPPALADLLRQRADQLGRPQRFTVQVAQARQWQRPGVLLLGDAAHPMSPIRAQGINQALRDSLVAAQELLQVTTRQGQASDHSAIDEAIDEAIDAACSRIEAQRRPEITRLQALQLDEARQGHWIGHHALLRRSLAWGAALLGPVARRVWMARQRPLREGALWL